MFCQVEAWDWFNGYGVSELTQNVRNKPLLIVSLEKLPGWQEVEGRRKLCNCQIIWNINNSDVVNVNASDHKDQISSGICVNLTKEDRDFSEDCSVLHLYFVSLETNESFESHTITILFHSYLKCLSHWPFLTRWFIWGKDTAYLAKFPGYCFLCLEDRKCLSFRLWAMVYQLGNLSSLSFFLKTCIPPPPVGIPCKWWATNPKGWPHPHDALLRGRRGGHHLWIHFRYWCGQWWLETDICDCSRASAWGGEESWSHSGSVLSERCHRRGRDIQTHGWVTTWRPVWVSGCKYHNRVITPFLGGGSGNLSLKACFY